MSIPSLPQLSQLPLLRNLLRRPTDHDQAEMTDEDLKSLSPGTVFALSDIAEASTLLLPMLAAVGKPLDDRTLVMEKLVALLQRLPLNSQTSEFIAHKFIALLWRDLPHPAGTNVHAPSKVTTTEKAEAETSMANTRFRNADGSYNNLIHPDMGKAGTPYARSVPPGLPKPINLPNPELVYDKLLRRPEGTFEAHPRGLSRLFFSFATIVIHECFQTSDQSRQDLNGTTSYVDLSTLYGNNDEEQKSVRKHVHGKLLEDSFASCHVGMMPPGVIAVLLMFSRNHNYIAQRVYEINEGGLYKPWSSLDTDGKKRQDEMIFQLTRNINVGFFATIVLKDYVSAILATKEANSEWWLNLGAEIHDPETGRLERGTGLQNTSEFNTLYRWHATLSASDSEWMKTTVLSELHKNPDNKNVTMDTINAAQFYQVAGAIKKKMTDQTPNKWTWPGYLDRGKDGRFSDAQLSGLITSCMEEPAHRFGAKAIPSAMRIVDVLGQIVTRNTFQLCTMNEFRRYLNLKTFSSFEEWNSDKSIASAASELYGGQIDNLEIYPGLLAEESKPPVPGSGLCPGHTIGRAILADAVQLVRGDRFLTFDFNASTLTNWGAQQIVTFAGGSYGGLLPLLLQRGLPDHYDSFSTWTLMPFHVPSASHAYLTKNGVIDKYKTQHPQKRVVLHTNTYATCKQVLEQPQIFDPPKVKELGHVRLQYTTPHRGTPIDDEVLRKAFLGPDYKASTEAWVRDCMRHELFHHTIRYNNKKKAEIDIVRDICNNVPIRWLAHKLGIPVKTPTETPAGAYAVRELQETLTDLFVYSELDGMTRDAWDLREKAEKQWSRLNHDFRSQIYGSYGIAALPKTVQGMLTADFDHNHSTTSRPGLAQMASKLFSAATHPLDTLTEAANTLTEAANTVKQMRNTSSEASRTFYSKLRGKKDDFTGEQCVDVCFALAVPLGAIMTRQLSLVIDLFLEPQHTHVRERIVALAVQEGEASAAGDAEISGYIMDAMRIRGIVRGLPRIALRTGNVHGSDATTDRIEFNIGDTVIANFHAANHDESVFSEPDVVMSDRQADLYDFVGCAPYISFGNEAMMPVMLTVIKEVFKLTDLRRGSVNGTLSELSEGLGRSAELSKVYLDQRWNETHSPTTMTVEFDPETRAVPVSSTAGAKASSSATTATSAPAATAPAVPAAPAPAPTAAPVVSSSKTAKTTKATA